MTGYRGATTIDARYNGSGEGQHTYIFSHSPTHTSLYILDYGIFFNVYLELHTAGAGSEAAWRKETMCRYYAILLHLLLCLSLDWAWY